jgi:hypothetical protein
LYTQQKEYKDKEWKGTEVKRTSVLCLENNSILVFKATDPKSKDNFYFLPGGKVEDLLTYARREFLENVVFIPITKDVQILIGVFDEK